MGKKRRNRRKAKWDEGGHWTGCLHGHAYQTSDTFPTFEYCDPYYGLIRVSSKAQLRGLVRDLSDHWDTTHGEAAQLVRSAPRVKSETETGGLPIFGYIDIPPADAPLLEELLDFDLDDSFIHTWESDE